MPEKINWKKIRAEYLRGDVTHQELADKYKISANTVRSRAMTEGWKDLRNKAYEKVNEKIVESVAESNAKTLAKIDDAVGNLCSVILENIEMMKTGGYSRDASSVKTTLQSLKEARDMLSGRYANEDKSIEATARLKEKEAEAFEDGGQTINIRIESPEINDFGK